MQKYTDLYDVLIIGAGPAGSNAAISYKKLNPTLKVGLIDKAIFPRDKSCGDAIGPGVISALKRFNNEHILENEPQVVSTTLYGPENIGIQNYIPEVKNKEDSISSQYSFFADGCTAACLLIKASDYKKINGFKSDVCPSAHSDSYLYNSIRKLGKYIIYQPQAEAKHYESYSRTFYYPDDIESLISFNLLNSDANKGLLTKEVVNFN